jgi:hypothetical protein
MRRREHNLHIAHLDFTSHERAERAVAFSRHSIFFYLPSNYPLPTFNYFHKVV